MPPNGYDTLMQQTSIPLKEIIPLPPNQIPFSLLVKISSSHHRFRLWWLCYLCLCCFQNIFWPLIEILPFFVNLPLVIFRLLCGRSSNHHRFGLCCPFSRCFQTPFLPLVETFPFLWVCRWLFLVYCAEGIAATSVHVAFRLPFLPLVETFPFLWIRRLFLVCCVEGF